MKERISTLILIAISLVSKATIHTVSNDPNKPAQFNTIAAAFAAAANGDTIYVYGSTAGYGDLNINKPITIIGSGFNTRKEFFQLSRFNLITLSDNVTNVTLDGIVLARFVPNTVGAFNYSNVTLRNCHIFSEISYLLDGNAIVNCSGNISNMLIDNCIIYQFNMHFNLACAGTQPVHSSFLVKNSLIGFFRHNNNIFFSNCQFGIHNNNSCSFFFQNNRENTFENCLFVRMHFEQFNTNRDNVFNNCMTHETQAPSPDFDLQAWTNGATGSASNCVINQNPLFTSIAINCNLLVDPVTYKSSLWNPVMNPGSPALNAGTGGTHIGLPGGPSPYRFNGEPNIPVVRKFQLINSIVPPNGTLTLKATATKAQ